MSLFMLRGAQLTRTSLVSSRAFSALSFESFKSSTATETPTKTMVCLHGILGSKKNWRTPSNIFTKKHPQFHAVAMDHRGHGSSSNSLPGAHTVKNTAIDVLRTLESKDLPELFRTAPPTIICGHSYSGKVVLLILEVLMKRNAPLPEHVWVLDSMPGVYDRALDASHQQSVVGIINTIMQIPSEFESKAWVEQHLAEQKIPKSVIDWLSTNIVPVENADGSTKTPKAFRYSFDIATVKHLFDDFVDLSMWDFLEQYSGDCKIHFIRAGKNKAWTQETIDRFAQLSERNPNIQLHTMPHVGHWLHAEDVHGMLDIIAAHSNVTKE